MRLTATVRSALAAAPAYAADGNAQPAHILAALLDEPLNTAIELIRRAGADPDEVRMLVQQRTASARARLADGSWQLSSPAKQVVELALNEARTSTAPDPCVHSGHLLLALLRLEQRNHSRTLRLLSRSRETHRFLSKSPLSAVGLTLDTARRALHEVAILDSRDFSLEGTDAKERPDAPAPPV